MKSNYRKYFRSHYKLNYNVKSVSLYRKWFYSQWKQIIKHLDFAKSKSILEIGSGIGTMFSYVKENFETKYTGLELDNEAVKFANNFYKTDVFINKSFENYNSKITFDRVFAFEVLEHLDNPDLCIKKINDLLKKDGIFIGTSPYPFFKNVVADKTHKYVLHPENWRMLFLENNFTEVNTYPMSFIPFVWRLNKYINICLPFYIPFKNFISTTLIIAKK